MFLFAIKQLNAFFLIDAISTCNFLISRKPITTWLINMNALIAARRSRPFSQRCQAISISSCAADEIVISACVRSHIKGDEKTASVHGKQLNFPVGMRARTWRLIEQWHESRA